MSRNVSNAPAQVSVRALPGTTWETIAVGAAAWLSNGMTSPLLLVYLTQTRDLSPGFAGILITLATVLGLFAQPIGGRLVDRIGPAHAFVMSLALIGAGALGLALAGSLTPIVLAIVVLRVGQQVSSGTSSSLLFASVHDRSYYPAASAAQYMVTNACSGTGGLLAGFLASTDNPASFTRLFLLQAALLAVAGSLAWIRLTRRIPRPAATGRRTRPLTVAGERRGLRRTFRDPNDPFGNYAFRWAFLLGFLYPIFGNQQLFTGLPLHITRIAHQSTHVVGIAFAANTYTIVATQILAFHLLRGRRRGTVVSAMFTLLVLVWLVVLAADRQSGTTQVAGFALAAALIGLGEVMLTISAPPIPALIAPPEQLGRYVSRYSMSRGTVQVIAPAMVGVLVDPVGGALMPIVMGSCAVVSGLYMARAARGLPPEVNRI